MTVSGALTGSADIYLFDGTNPLTSSETLATGLTDFTVNLPARSATLAVTALGSTAIFADGFESGDTAAWSATSSR